MYNKSQLKVCNLACIFHNVINIFKNLPPKCLSFLGNFDGKGEISGNIIEREANR